MYRKKYLFLSWLVSAGLIIGVFYIAMSWLWTAVAEFYASSLETQVVSALSNDLSEGNLFKLGATLSKLKRDGLLVFAEIRQFETSKTSNLVFKIQGVYEQTEDVFNRFECGEKGKIVARNEDKVSLITTLPATITGVKCSALFIISELPDKLIQFKRRILISFGISLTALFGLFSWLTLTWHRKLLNLEIKSKLIAIEKEAEIGRIAAQVAHDICSPLAALDAALKGFEIPPERKELVNAATARIRGIAEDLLKKYKVGGLGKDEQKNTQATDLAEITESILLEKKAQYPDIEFAFEKPKKALMSDTEPKEFGRIISNLINNSAEAITEENRDERIEKNKGTVKISLKAEMNKAILSVKDNGEGIPTEILSKIGKKGFTYGKESGTGLGLWHAISNVEKWGGNLKIESKLKIGTEIIIELPLTSVPCHPTVAVLIDDDPLVRKNWELSAKKKGISLKIFKNAEDFLNTTGDFPKNAAIYIDSELENGIKGEEIAKKIYSLGFREIYLETGHSKDSFKNIPHIKDIIGKEPPF